MTVSVLFVLQGQGGALSLLFRRKGYNLSIRDTINRIYMIENRNDVSNVQILNLQNK